VTWVIGCSGASQERGVLNYILVMTLMTRILRPSPT
jgi:hypothetical protein